MSIVSDGSQELLLPMQDASLRIDTAAAARSNELDARADSPLSARRRSSHYGNRSFISSSLFQPTDNANPLLHSNPFDQDAEPTSADRYLVLSVDPQRKRPAHTRRATISKQRRHVSWSEAWAHLVHESRDPVTLRWRIPPSLSAYTPFLVWLAVSVVFGVAISIWHGPIFAALDQLSYWMKTHGLVGYILLFIAIVITCCPPMPMCSFPLFPL